MNYKYKPSKYVKNRVKKFAEDRITISSNLYKWRGEQSQNKMVEDIIVGTLGEYAVQNYLSKELGRPCTRPDLKIYDKRNKSYSADLTSGDLKIHVKSQSCKSVKRYGLSWLFQRKDKLVSEPKDNEYIAFCSVDSDTYEVTIVGFVHPAHLKELELWGECKVPMYRKTKVALYLEELDPYGIVLNNVGGL